MTRFIRKNLLAAAALCTSLWGCSAENITDDSGKKSLQALVDELVAEVTAEGGVAQVVGTQGGTVEDSASGAAIEIPAGALPEADAGDAYVVSIVPYTGATLEAPASFSLAGDLVDINIQSVRAGTSVQPLAPVRITLAYAGSVEGEDTALLAVGNFHSSAWVTQPADTVDTAALRVTASFATLSPFGPLLGARGNSVPVADDQSVTVNEDAVLAGAVTGSDADGDSLAFTLAADGDVQHGTLTLQSNGDFEYTPSANYYGSDEFKFIANDGAADSAAATVSITVKRVNNVPTLSGLHVTTVVNTPVDATLVGADADGNALSYAVSTAPEHGWVVITASTGALTYTPVTNYTGTDVFYVQASDDAASSDPVAVMVDVVGLRRYVRPSATGSGDGTSWANATASLQTAIDDVAAAGAGEVWIAKGTYRSTGTGALITMKDNADLYGGFAGTEASLAERGVVDPAATVLSGDTDSSGTLSAGDAYRVVVGATARLDGVTITGGNAVEIGYTTGAGVYNTAGKNLSLTNVHITGNHANADGGGIYNMGKLTIRNSRVDYNTAANGAGINAYNYNNGDLVMENTAVIGNTASQSAGGVYVLYGPFTFSHGLIDGNSASQNAGGIFLSNVQATVVNSQISNNSVSTWRGGGIYSSSSELVVIHTQFVGNSAATAGGAIALMSSPTFTLRNSSFWGNTAPSGKDVLNPAASSVFNTCAEDNLSGFGTDNSTATTTPFVAPAASGEYFFDPAHGCSNWGDAATATTLFSTTGVDWENWSSEISGEVVEGTTAGVAAGTLRHPEDAWIRTFEVTVDTISWLTNAGAATCRISNDADSNVVQLGASDLPASSQGHALTAGTVLTMTCDSALSFPKAATATVP